MGVLDFFFGNKERGHPKDLARTRESHKEELDRVRSEVRDETLSEVRRGEGLQFGLNFAVRAARIAEAGGPIGPALIDSDDNEFRPAGSARSIYDLNDGIRRQMIRQVDHMFKANPLAHHIVEIYTAFGVGTGITFKAADRDLQEVLRKHWEDPVNDWPRKQIDRFRGFVLFGEQVWPAFVEDGTGHVRISSHHPQQIQWIKTDRDNHEIFDKVAIVQGDLYAAAPQDAGTRVYQIIRPRDIKGHGVRLVGKIDEEPEEVPADGATETHDVIGSAFYHTLNRVPGSTRGFSLLLPILDWLSVHDDFLFTTQERARVLLSVVWDVLLKGAKPDEVKEWVDRFGKIRPNTVWAHNEGMEVNVHSPQIDARENAEQANQIKNQALVGAGFPDFWAADSGNANQAKSSEMGIPTTMRLALVQRAFKFVVHDDLVHQRDMAIIKGGLRPKSERIEVRMPRIWLRDISTVTEALGKFTMGLGSARDDGLLKDRQAQDLFDALLQQMGLEISEIEAAVMEDSDIEGDLGRLDKLASKIAAMKKAGEIKTPADVTQALVDGLKDVAPGLADQLGTIADIDAEEAAQLFRYHIELGVVTINEARAFLDLPPLKDGNITFPEFRAQRPELFEQLPESIRESYLEAHPEEATA